MLDFIPFNKEEGANDPFKKFITSITDLENTIEQQGGTEVFIEKVKTREQQISDFEKEQQIDHAKDLQGLGPGLMVVATISSMFSNLLIVDKYRDNIDMGVIEEIKDFAEKVTTGNIEGADYSLVAIILLQAALFLSGAGYTIKKQIEINRIKRSMKE